MTRPRADGGLEEAVIVVEKGSRAGEKIPTAFNPTEYGIQRSVQYGEQQIAGRSAPIQQFVSGDAASLSMDLFFDEAGLGSESGGTAGAGAGGSTDGGVAGAVEAVQSLLAVDDDLGAPPVCTFVWGRGIQFRALLESADAQYTMFRPDGRPTRARVSVTFTEYRAPSKEGGGQSGGGGGESGGGGGGPGGSQRRQRTVKDGDTLWGIAAEEYGDPQQWKRIASANGVEEPRSLQPGTDLTIPPASS